MMRQITIPTFSNLGARWLSDIDADVHMLLGVSHTVIPFQKSIQNKNL